MSKIRASVVAAVAELEKHGIVTYCDGTLEVYCRVRGDSPEYSEVSMAVRNLMCCFPSRGMHWGNDGIGYEANRSRNLIIVFRSIETKSVAKILEELLGI